MSELESVHTPPPSAPAPSSQDRARKARESLIGKSIAGRYVLRSLLGHGGMGAVYEAENVGIGKRVAIKFVDQEFIADEQVLTRFAREARAMSSIESAHIVTIFDAGTEDGRPYLVMELLRGEDLGQLLRRTTRVPVADALHIIAMVLKGLSKAHAAGIVHRDLKPDNIFLVKNDDGAVHAKIVDFGVSKIERPRNRTSPLALTGRGTVLGTPFYMSPEQAQAMPDVDGRADLFSVGTILFECLAGRPPHTGETYEQIILSICMRDAPDLRSVVADVPAPVAAFVARALARERAQRWATADEMLAALHELSPAEKKLVPREPPPTNDKTLVVGVAPVPASVVARPFQGNATQIAGSGQGAGVTSAATPVSVPAQLIAPPSGPRSGPTSNPTSHPSAPLAASSTDLTPAGIPQGRPMGTIVVAAAIATVLGVVATFAILSALGKKPAPSPALASSVAVTPSAQVSGVPVSALPAVSVAQPAAPAVTESAASAAPKPVVAPAPAPAPAPLAAPVVAPRPVAVANSGGKPPPAPVAAPKPPPGPGKSLDIARDLP